VSGDEEMEHEEGDVMDEDEDMDDTKLMSSLEYFGQNKKDNIGKHAYSHHAHMELFFRTKLSFIISKY
jgi:hypothetical protein